MDLDEPIGLLIGAVRRRIRQAVGHHVRRYRLSTQQFWMLVAISEHPGLSLGELAARVRIDLPTASRVVAALMRRKLVQVKGDASDRRRARLHLRAPGEVLARELQGLAAAVRAAVVHGLSTAEQTALRSGLRKIIANMDRLHNGKAPAGSRASSADRARARTL